MTDRIDDPTAVTPYDWERETLRIQAVIIGQNKILIHTTQMQLPAKLDQYKHITEQAIDLQL